MSMKFGVVWKSYFMKIAESFNFPGGVNSTRMSNSHWDT